MTAPSQESLVVRISAKDLPVFCPNPAMPIWNHHPRVYLEIATTGYAKCPYCGTEYHLAPGDVVRGH